MALEWLKGILGDAYSDEIDSKVSQEVGKGFVSRKDFNDQKKAADDLRAQITDRDTQIKALQDSSGDLGVLQKQLDDQKKAHEKEINALKMQFATEKALADAGARNTTAAMALLAEFMKTAKLNDDGSVEGLDQKIKELTEGEGTSFLFQKKEPQQTTINGAHPATPGNQKGAADDTSDYSTRLAAAKESGDLAAISHIKREAAAKGISLL